jgi:hypothetical protein
MLQMKRFGTSTFEDASSTAASLNPDMFRSSLPKSLAVKPRLPAVGAVVETQWLVVSPDNDQRVHAVGFQMGSRLEPIKPLFDLADRRGIPHPLMGC